MDQLSGKVAFITGVSTFGVRFEDIGPELWDRVIAINLAGVYNGVHYFLAGMQAAGGGHIVNSSSMAGLLGVPMGGPYAASKFAIVGLSESLRAELVDSAIGVSVLCPGSVRTRLWRTSRAVRGLPDVDVPPPELKGGSARSRRGCCRRAVHHDPPRVSRLSHGAACRSAPRIRTCGGIPATARGGST